VTAPPDKNKCPILSNYKKVIKDSNIRSILYVSSTGVYGDHKGKWVYENSVIKGKNNLVNKNRIKAENSWASFCTKNLLVLNIVRLGGIYGLGRPNINNDIFKDIIVKKDHFFSRIHVLDISRLIVNILFDSNKNSCWNLVDELPTTRKNFIERIIKLKKVKVYNFRNYEELKKDISEPKKKFWEANKKVSSQKVKKKFRYTFLFPSYMEGLKYIIRNS
jgi:nucleoside-diphosphate-sugar epimerase